MNNINGATHTNDNNETTSINITMSKDVVNQIDIAREIFKNGSGGILSRSQFIEYAARQYLTSLQPAITLLQSTPKQEEEQVIIFTARESIGTYAKYFHNFRWEDESLSPRIRQDINSGKLRYLALYKTSPSNYIDEYAQILSIYPSPQNSNKWGFNLGAVQTLPHPVYIGNATGRSLSKGRVTTLNKLKTVKTVDQLF